MTFPFTPLWGYINILLYPRTLSKLTFKAQHLIVNLNFYIFDRNFTTSVTVTKHVFNFRSLYFCLVVSEKKNVHPIKSSAEEKKENSLKIGSLSNVSTGKVDKTFLESLVLTL